MPACRSAPRRRTPATTWRRSGAAARHSRGSTAGAASAATVLRPRQQRSRLKPLPQVSPGTAGTADAGTVVGAMQSSDRDAAANRRSPLGGVKAMPAVRAHGEEARRGLDPRHRAPAPMAWSRWHDVKQAADAGSARDWRGARPSRRSCRSSARSAAHPRRQPRRRTAYRAPAGPGRHAQRSDAARDRRARYRRARSAACAATWSRVMAEAHARGGADHADGRCRPARLVARRGHHGAADPRIVVAAAAVEPALNAWFDAAAGTLRRALARRRRHRGRFTEDGLFVPALRNCRRSSMPQRCAPTQPPSRRRRESQPPGRGTDRLHDFAFQLRRVRRPLRHADRGAAVRVPSSAPASCATS